jgi:hypothetical protein
MNDSFFDARPMLGASLLAFALFSCGGSDESGLTAHCDAGCAASTGGTTSGAASTTGSGIASASGSGAAVSGGGGTAGAAGGTGGPGCGNGQIDGAEQCDHSNINGGTCASATMNSMPTGPLGCLPNCTFDTSKCVGATGSAGAGGTTGAGGSAGAGGTAGTAGTGGRFGG